MYETYGCIDQCRRDTTGAIRLDIRCLGACRRWEIDRQSGFAELVSSGLEPGCLVFKSSGGAAISRPAIHAAALWLEGWADGRDHGLCLRWIDR